MRYKVLLVIIGFQLIYSCSPIEIESVPGRYLRPIFDSVTTTKDIPYSSSLTIGGELQVQHFDFYEPYNDSAQNRRCLILVHGGGFLGGGKEHLEQLADSLAKHGYCCVSIDYRLYDKPDKPITHDDFTSSILIGSTDILKAISFLSRELADTDPYCIDKDNFVVIGYSAGAIAALHSISSPSNDWVYPPIKDYIQSNGWLLEDSLIETAGSKIHGIISLAGSIIDTSMINLPYTPVFCVHGMSDHIVPFSNGTINLGVSIKAYPSMGSQLVVERCQQLGLISNLVALPNIDHINFVKAVYYWLAGGILFIDKCFSEVQ